MSCNRFYSHIDVCGSVLAVYAGYWEEWVLTLMSNTWNKGDEDKDMLMKIVQLDYHREADGNCS